MNIMNSLGESLKQTAINYFVYLAKQVQIKIQAQNLEEYHHKSTKNQGLFVWLFICFFIFEIVSLTYYIIEKTNNLDIFEK